MENGLHTLASAINCRDWNGGADTTPYCNLYGLHLAFSIILNFLHVSAVCIWHSVLYWIFCTFVQPAFGILSWLNDWNDKKILMLFLNVPLVLNIGPEPVQNGVTTTDLNWCTHSSYRPPCTILLFLVVSSLYCHLLFAWVLVNSPPFN